jgi:hypothetical protein
MLEEPRPRLGVGRSVQHCLHALVDGGAALVWSSPSPCPCLDQMQANYDTVILFTSSGGRETLAAPGHLRLNLSGLAC